MANDKIISLKQLTTSITKIREFVDNNYASIKHDHNDIYYTRKEIDEQFSTSNATIDKLKEDIENMTFDRDIKELKDHIDEKIVEVIGDAPEELRTLEDLAKALKSLETKLAHPLGNGYNHIPKDGTDGQILRYASEGTAEWADMEVAARVLEANNDDINKMLDKIFD